MSGNHLSEHQLERLALGLLPADRAASAEGHLGACAECRGRLEVLRQDQASHLASHDPQLFARRVLASAEQRAAERGPRFRWPWIGGMLVPAAVAVVVFFARTPRVDEPYLGVKGGAHLEVRTPEGPLRDGAMVHPGQAIRFVVASTHAGYALILGLNERGEFFAYYPLQGASSAPLEAGPAIVLPGSVVLDDQLGRERFYLLVTDRPVQVADIEAAVRAGHVTFAAPELPIHGEQTSVLLDKVK